MVPIRPIRAAKRSVTPRVVRRARRVAHPIRHARRRATSGLIWLAVACFAVGAALHVFGLSP